MHSQDYIPATRNENKNAVHKRSKQDFRLAVSAYRRTQSAPIIMAQDMLQDDAEDTYFETGLWS